jgi:hypothetical protein
LAFGNERHFVLRSRIEREIGNVSYARTDGINLRMVSTGFMGFTCSTCFMGRPCEQLGIVWVLGTATMLMGSSPRLGGHQRPSPPPSLGDSTRGSPVPASSEPTPWSVSSCSTKGEAGGGGSREELLFAPFPSSSVGKSEISLDICLHFLGSVRGVLLSASNGLGLGLSDLGWA